MSKQQTFLVLTVAAALAAAAVRVRAADAAASTDAKARALLGQMTLDEKIGQMTQVDMLRDEGPVRYRPACHRLDAQRRRFRPGRQPAAAPGPRPMTASRRWH